MEEAVAAWAAPVTRSDLDEIMVEWQDPSEAALQAVLDRNEFITRMLPAYVKSGLTPEDLAAYAAPYPTRESRLAMLRWTQSVPFDGRNPDVLHEADETTAWLQDDGGLPIKLMYSPESYTRGAFVDWIRWNIPRVMVEAVPDGYNHFPEDHPTAVGQAIRDFAVTFRR